MAKPEIYSSLGQDPDFQELVEMYVAEMPERIERLQQLYERGEFAELNRFAHQLKGSAGGYGFEEISPAAARVECAATLEPDLATLEQALNELLELCGRARCGSPAE